MVRFGPPLILRVWRDLTHSQFQSVVLKAMAKHLREGVKLADVSVYVCGMCVCMYVLCMHVVGMGEGRVTLYSKWSRIHPLAILQANTLSCDQGQLHLLCGCHGI